MTTERKIKILRCDKVEIVGTMGERKNDKLIINVIATVTMKDGKPVVEAKDSKIKQEIMKDLTGESWKELWQKMSEDEKKKHPDLEKWPGLQLRWTEVDSFGFRAQVISFHKPGDPFFLEAVTGDWGDNRWGYEYVWAREAGKIWEEEIPKAMIRG